MEEKQASMMIRLEDPTYSCKLRNQLPPIGLLRGPPYSFSDSCSFKCGLCHDCLSSGFSYGWKHVHKCFFCHDQHNHITTPSSYAHHHLNFLIPEKTDVECSNDLIRLPVPDVDSVNPLLTRLIQQLCVENAQHPRVLVIEDKEDENDKISKFCDACTLPMLSDESCDFYRHKWCADLPNELKDHPIHPNHLLSLFTSTTPNHDVFTCKGCNFPVNGFGFKCTECSSSDNYSICIRCASLPRSILHESHEHPLALTSPQALHGSNYNSKGVTAACCNQVQNATFACDECDFVIHGSCALLPRMIKHRYDQRHPFTLLYPTTTYVNDKDAHVDPSARPFCEICEKDVSAKANEGWLYHCRDCDMFGCIQCFLMDLNFLSMIN